MPNKQQTVSSMQPNCKHLLATILLLLLQQVYGQNATTNYCQPGLCSMVKKHIACRNNGVSTSVGIGYNQYLIV